MSRATGTARQVGFMCFMMWMMGNSLQIFPLIMTVSGLSTSLMAVLKSREGESQWWWWLMFLMLLYRASRLPLHQRKHAHHNSY